MSVFVSQPFRLVLKLIYMFFQPVIDKDILVVGICRSYLPIYGLGPFSPTKVYYPDTYVKIFEEHQNVN